MRPSRLLLIASLLAVPLLATTRARAQQVASVTTCTTLADAGTVGDAGTVACPPVFTNFQPVVAQCTLTTPAHESNSEIIYFEGCTQQGGVTTCAPIADAGYSLIPLTGGGAAAATTSISVTLTPIQNPWAYMQPVVVGTTGEISDGGANASGFTTCNYSVVQSQTIHAAKPKLKN
jgi:hypothetical protein